MRLLVPFVFYLIMLPCTALCQEDSLDNKRLASMITLTDVVIGKDFNVARFITLVKNDTTFYLQAVQEPAHTRFYFAQ